MTPQTKEILVQYANGLITKDERDAELEKLEVRGDSDLGTYVGYDYRHQQWVRVHLYDLRAFGMYILPNRDELAELVRVVKSDIADDYRAFGDDEEPGIQLTIGANAVGDWDYQTGDNSFTGAAYHYPYWAVVGVYRDSQEYDVVDDILSQLRDQMENLE